MRLDCKSRRSTSESGRGARRVRAGSRRVRVFEPSPLAGAWRTEQSPAIDRVELSPLAGSRRSAPKSRRNRWRRAEPPPLQRTALCANVAPQSAAAPAGAAAATAALPTDAPPSRAVGAGPPPSPPPPPPSSPLRHSVAAAAAGCTAGAGAAGPGRRRRGPTSRDAK